MSHGCACGLCCSNTIQQAAQARCCTCTWRPCARDSWWVQQQAHLQPPKTTMPLPGSSAALWLVRVGGASPVGVTVTQLLLLRE